MLWKSYDTIKDMAQWCVRKEFRICRSRIYGCREKEKWFCSTSTRLISFVSMAALFV